MILDELEISKRMESPLNLINRLRKSLVNNSDSRNSIPCLPVISSEQIIDDLTEKINNGSVKSKATGIMISAMDELKIRLPEVSKPERLAQIAAEMSKVVASQTKDKNNNNDSNKPQIIIYAPQMVSENNFEVMVVNE